MMRYYLTIVFLLLAMSGCNSPGRSNPVQVSPTEDDWKAAFSRLSLQGQALIKNTTVSLDASGSVVDGSIRHMDASGLTQELIETECLDITAICNGFNRVFGSGVGRKWTIVNASSYEQIGSPGGLQKHRFELDWTFRDTKGRKVSVSEMDSGPGVNIIWWPPRTAIDDEMNQAFALTFLKLVVDLEEQSPGT